MCQSYKPKLVRLQQRWVSNRNCDPALPGQMKFWHGMFHSTKAATTLTQLPQVQWPQTILFTNKLFLNPIKLTQTGWRSCSRIGQIIQLAKYSRLMLEVALHCDITDGSTTTVNMSVCMFYDTLLHIFINESVIYWLKIIRKSSLYFFGWWPSWPAQLQWRGLSSIPVQEVIPTVSVYKMGISYNWRFKCVAD